MRDIWTMRFALHSIFLYLRNPKSMQKRTLLDGPKFQITIKRLCHQLIENHTDFSNTVLIGIQPRGSYFADRVQQELSAVLPESKIRKGNLDITFFRDDFRRKDGLVSASSNSIDFIIEGKNVVLIDDVLWTGRTIRAALDALLAFGRPAKVELMVLIDRRFSRHVPIEADYTGQEVDSVDSQLVRVAWKEVDGEDRVILLSDRNK
jgi:pyrimidine operon attenuation protein/uracil phosphoribosyltransferase